MLIRAFLFAALLACAAPALATPSLVVDAESLDVLHAEDAGQAWYPASTTKLMTAFVVFEQLRAGRVTLATEVVFSRNALGRDSVKSGLTPGSVMFLEDALYAMLGVSANDAAVAIAETVAGGEAAFIALMNDAARRLGMTHTHFANPDGLFDGAQVSTARDLALLGIAIDRQFSEYLRFFNVSEVRINDRTQDSRNDLLTRFPGAIGLKTGFVCASGRNIVGLATQNGRRLVVVVLGATTDRERSERAAGLLRTAFEAPAGTSGVALPQMQNEVSSRPEDMRARLCSPKADAYERQQARRYPMGLPGHASNLSEPVAPNVRNIVTWQAPPTVPAPPPRPAQL